MPSPSPSALFLKLLHRSLRDQAQPGRAPGRAQKNQEALEGLLPFLFQGQGAVEFRVLAGGFACQGRPVTGAAEASRFLAEEFDRRALGGMALHPDLDPEDLKNLLFILHLSPQRLAEMGGPGCVLAEDGGLRLLAKAALPPAPEPRAEPPARPAERVLEVDWSDLLALGPPEPAAGHRSAALAKALQGLFEEALAQAKAEFKDGPRCPWGLDQREALKRFGFARPDFRSLLGTSARLGLDTLGPVAVRELVRKALAGLEAAQQGDLLLGLPAFPPAEQALRQALDFLAPEFLGRAVTRVWLRDRPSLFELPLLALALMQAVPDWNLALEAIQVHLQAEGWSDPDLAAFQEAVQWEVQGTDTKLRLSLNTHGVHQLDPRLVKILGRSLLRSGRVEDLEVLLEQVESELRDPKAASQRHGAEILGDLASALPMAGLPLAFEQRLFLAARDGLAGCAEPDLGQGFAQAVEGLVGHWLRRGRNRDAHAAMRFLRDLLHRPQGLPPWQRDLLQGLLTRLIAEVRANLQDHEVTSPVSVKGVFSIYQGESGST